MEMNSSVLKENINYYENCISLIESLYEINNKKYKTYRQEFCKLLKKTPKTSKEAMKLAKQIKKLHNNIHDTFVIIKEYNKQLVNLQIAEVMNEIEYQNNKYLL